MGCSPYLCMGGHVNGEPGSRPARDNFGGLVGVEHALACTQCKQWIDLHKCYDFHSVTQAATPPIDTVSVGHGYWTGRGIWFRWNTWAINFAGYTIPMTVTSA